MDYEYITVLTYPFLNGLSVSVRWTQIDAECNRHSGVIREVIELPECAESLQSIIERIAEELFNLAPSAEQTAREDRLSASGGLPEGTPPPGRYTLG